MAVSLSMSTHGYRCVSIFWYLISLITVVVTAILLRSVIDICWTISFIVLKEKDNADKFVAWRCDANCSHLWFLSIRITTVYPPCWLWCWNNDEDEDVQDKKPSNKRQTYQEKNRTWNASLAWSLWSPTVCYEQSWRTLCIDVAPRLFFGQQCALILSFLLGRILR